MNARLEAKAKLEKAIDEYVDVVSNMEGTVRTDYILTVAAANIHMPAHTTQYFHEHSGSIHAQAGLMFMQSEELKEQNREQADLDAE